MQNADLAENTVSIANSRAAPDSTAVRYAAFISYRHVEPDRKWARWLHVSLETYRVPGKLQREMGLGPRLGLVFRDEEELPASSDLSSEITQALERSQYLIVVCSPRTPASMWVNREVQWFRERGRGDQILCLLIEGEPADAFPAALRGIRQTVTDAGGPTNGQNEEIEPLAADVRGSESGSHGRLHARLRLAAAVLGVRYDDLRRREHERRQKRLLLAGSVLSALVVMMAGLATIAWVQRAQAVRLRSLAEQQTQLAQANARRASENEVRAVAGETLAVEKGRAAEISRAQGLVDEADALSLAGRRGQAADTYEKAYADLVMLGAPLLHVEAGLCNLYARSPPPLLTIPANRGGVTCVALSLDGRTGLSGGFDNAVIVWDVPSGRPIRTLSGHGGSVRTVAISADGTTVASGSDDKTIKLWDLAGNGKVTTLHGHTDRVRSLGFSADGLWLLSGSDDKTIKLWDLTTGKDVRTFEGHHGPVSGVAFCPDGLTALSGSWDSSLILWDLADARILKTLRGHAKGVSGIAVSPDGRTALSASWDHMVKIWDLASAKEVRTLTGHTKEVDAVAFLADGKRAVSAAGDATVRLWDLSSGRGEQAFIIRPARSAVAVAVSRDGRVAFSGYSGFSSSSWDRTGIVASWGISDMADVGCFRVPAHQSATVALSSDSRTALMNGIEDGTLSLVDLATGKNLCSLRGPAGWAGRIVFLPDGRTAVSSHNDRARSISVWDVAAGKPVRTFPSGHDGPITCLAACPDGRTIISASSDRTLKTWDLTTGHELHTLRGHAAPVSYDAVSFDGKRAVSSDNQAVDLWDVDTGVQLRSVSDDVSVVAFCLDGTMILLGGNSGSVGVWDAGSAGQPRGLGGHGDLVQGFAVSRGRTSAASCSRDGTLKLWDLQLGRELQTFSWDDIGRMDHVALGADGRMVLGGGNDVGVIRTWDLSRADRYHELGPQASDARRALRSHPDDINALAVMGEWYAFRGLNHWAVEMLQAALAGGVKVRHLTLAQCWWRLERLNEARHEYQKALEESKDESERSYLALCLVALDRAPATGPAN